MSAGTFAVSEAVELATVSRNGFIESRHAGSAIVLSAGGDTLRTLGNPDAVVFTRSALKPLQSLAMHSAGLELDSPAQVALSMASHGGAAGHLQLVAEVLDAGGLAEEQLLCPEDWPMDGTARDAVIAAGGSRRRAAMCCSGKHAAMLRTCLVNDWPVATYTAHDHPLQVAIRETVQRFTGEKPAPIGVDGCGAPVLGISLAGLARGIRRMATAEAGSPFPLHRTAASIVSAAREHAWVVEGPGRPDTVVMERLGVFAKFGAEGISVMSAPNGVTCAVKILDGSPRAAVAVALALLTQAGALDAARVAETLAELRLTVFGGGVPVGAIEPSFASDAPGQRVSSSA